MNNWSLEFIRRDAFVIEVIHGEHRYRLGTIEWNKKMQCHGFRPNAGIAFGKESLKQIYDELERLNNKMDTCSWFVKECKRIYCELNINGE